MHGTRCSQVGTLGVWRDSSHPPNPPSPFINLNYASSWGKRLFSACSKFVMDSVVAMLASSIQIGRPFGRN